MTQNWTLKENGVVLTAPKSLTVKEYTSIILSLSGTLLLNLLDGMNFIGDSFARELIFSHCVSNAIKQKQRQKRANGRLSGGQLR